LENILGKKVENNRKGAPKTLNPLRKRNMKEDNKRLNSISVSPDRNLINITNKINPAVKNGKF
jgi:hypothetical protein